MKRRWGVIIGMGCAVAALVLAMRGWTPDTTLEISPPTVPGDDRRALDEQAAAGGPTGPRSGAISGAAADPRGGSARGPTRGGENSAGDRGELSRRLAPAIAGAQNGADRRGSGRRADTRGAIEGLTLPDAAKGELTDRRSDHTLPPAGSRGTQSAAGAMDEPVPDPIPEVAYDGGADHVFDTASRAEVADAGTIAGDAGTISFWIEPQWQPNDQADASFIQLGDSGFQIVKSGNLLRFDYIDGSGQQYGGIVDISEWQAGDWRHVLAAWTGNTMSLYVNGSQVFLNTAPTPPDFQSDTKLWVGSEPTNGAPVAPAQLSYLTVLNRSVSSDEVRQMFETGGPPHH